MPAVVLLVDAVDRLAAAAEPPACVAIEQEVATQSVPAEMTLILWWAAEEGGVCHAVKDVSYREIHTLPS